MVDERSVEQRAAVHAALGEPSRLAIVDQLAGSDRSPQELQDAVGVPSNLLAHHLDVLEAAGLIERSRSSGDGRRRYVHLLHDQLDHLGPRHPTDQRAGAVRVHRELGPLAARRRPVDRDDRRAGVERRHPPGRRGCTPARSPPPGAPASTSATRRRRRSTSCGDRPALTITVCDRAHEELDPEPGWLHWSIPDPVPVGTAKAFDATVAELRQRIAIVAGAA